MRGLTVETHSMKLTCLRLFCFRLILPMLMRSALSEGENSMRGIRLFCLRFTNILHLTNYAFCHTSPPVKYMAFYVRQVLVVQNKDPLLIRTVSYPRMVITIQRYSSASASSMNVTPTLPQPYESSFLHILSSYDGRCPTEP